MKEILNELKKYAEENRVPIIKDEAMQVLIDVCKTKQPKNILEVGTAIGYSLLTMLDNISVKANVISLELDETRAEIAKNSINKACLTEFVEIIVGDAGKTLLELQKAQRKFDLVFIDADKINYTNYFDLVFDKVNKGGYILADNVLWSGKIIAPLSEMDKDTLALHQFNERIAHDNRLEKVLLPVRDGVMVMRKVKSEK